MMAASHQNDCLFLWMQIHSRVWVTSVSFFLDLAVEVEGSG